MNSLDRAARLRLSKLMDGLEQTAITITHDLDLIADYDRAILIHEGAVAADGPPAEAVAAYIAMVESGER
jgi:biotin transport system ATP-binding protein